MTQALSCTHFKNRACSKNHLFLVQKKKKKKSVLLEDKQAPEIKFFCVCIWLIDHASKLIA